jgi:hypothetical protein
MTRSSTLAAALLFVSVLSATAGADDAAFSIKVVAPPAQKATRATVKVHIAPGAGYHMNKDYPTSAKVAQPPAGVTVDKAAVHVEEAGADIEIPYTSAEAGKKTLAGELKFAVCSASSCDPKRAPLAVTVEVK